MLLNTDGRSNDVAVSVCFKHQLSAKEPLGFTKPCYKEADIEQQLLDFSFCTTWQGEN